MDAIKGCKTEAAMAKFNQIDKPRAMLLRQAATAIFRMASCQRNIQEGGIIKYLNTTEWNLRKSITVPSILQTTTFR